MDSPFRVEAQACAASAPVGMFGIDDVLIAIEVIDEVYQLWHACQKPASADSAVMASKVAAMEGPQFRKARHRVRHVTHKRNINMSLENQNAMTAHMLLHVHGMQAAPLALCCSQPPIQDEVND